MGGCFNLITSLGEKKGGKNILGEANEDFKEFIEDNRFVDVQIGNGWFTWNNCLGVSTTWSLGWIYFYSQKD